MALGSSHSTLATVARTTHGNYKLRSQDFPSQYHAGSSHCQSVRLSPNSNWLGEPWCTQAVLLSAANVALIRHFNM